MWYIYSLQTADQKHWYVGKTNNVKRRLNEHNAGESAHTKKYKNWKLISFTAFSNEQKADAFEKYLKTQSGRAFSKKAFIIFL